MASNSTTYPPDINCNGDGSLDYAGGFEDSGCPVTSNMVNFLNLTGANYKPYLAAYCVNPPADDDCPFGYCPNSDIAGSLVRVANYIIGFCLAILIFYSPKRIKNAFWSQILITYSLLITCGISLIKGQLTRFHSIVLVSIVCSPVNVYLTGYAIRSFWSTHRLEAVFGRGKKQFMRRLMVLFSVAVWMAILIYAYLPQRYTEFSQDSCRQSSIAEVFFLGTPFIAAWVLAEGGPSGIFVLFIFLAVPILIVLAWLIAIFLRRDEIWPSGRTGCCDPRYSKVWRVVIDNYPFLRFWSVVAIPTVYWIAIIEIGILAENDDTFSLTFGQVIGLFAAIPPIIGLAHLRHDLKDWSANLAWVLFIKRMFGGRPTRPPVPEDSDSKEMGTPKETV